MLIPGLFAALVVGTGPARAAIDAKVVAQGETVELTARSGFVYGGDGLAVRIWGLQLTGGSVQYPGPTLRMRAGETIFVKLTNLLPENSSLVFPGLIAEMARSDVNREVERGVFTWEAKPDSAALYRVTAPRPGTFYYQSGTDLDVQIEMGLFGALIVDPPEPGRAYGDTAAICPSTRPGGPNVVCSSYDREFLVLASEMDVRVHEDVQDERVVDTTQFHPVYWFLNGRNFPDTLLDDGTPLLPAQPYSALARMHPGDRVLIRMIGIGRDLHPFHTHGNHMLVIAEDGRLRESAPGVGADLAKQSFTYTVAPGQTADAIYSWSGEQLGWDVYGHAPGDPLQPSEAAADHGKPFPTPLLNPLSTSFGGWWSGSPFLGRCGPLPPGQGGFNASCSIPMMWHSHKDVELVNNDIFPGGMMTFVLIEHPDVPIP